MPLLLLALLLCLSLPLRAEPGPTLDSVLHQVLAAHPELEAAHLRVEAARAQASGAGAQPNPELRVAGRVGGPSEDQNYLTQRLEIAGQTGLRAEMARVDLSQADLQALILTRELVTRTARAYYGLWESAARRRMEASRLELVEALERVSLRRFQVGDISQNQLVRARLETTRVRAELVQARAEEEVARSRLNLLLQQPAETPLELPEQLSDEQPLPELPTLLSRAAGRPELELARLEVRQLELEADLTGRQRWPDLELTAYSANLSDQGEHGVRLGLVLPLWDWGRIGAEVEQKRLQAEASSRLVEARRQEVEQEVRAAAALHQAARQRRELLRGQVDSSLRLAAMTRKGFDAGLLTLLDVLDAQRAYREAVLEAVSAEADYHRTLLEANLLSGGPLFPHEEVQP